MFEPSDLTSRIRDELNDSYFNDFYQLLPGILEAQFNHYTHGQLERWLTIIRELPDISVSELDLLDSVLVKTDNSLSASQTTQLIAQLKSFKPWRKGPYSIHDVFIDSEWRSDWKWDRVKTQITQLTGRRVLDVGCGNAYHCWRMLGAGAKSVIGIDPSQLFWIQYQAIKHFFGSHPVTMLPIGIEALPDTMPTFDTVFSMGVLYHRKSPFEHLQQLKNLLTSDGELVLETLIIDGDINTVLVPCERYASMRNVWFIPSALALEYWIKRVGFKQVRLVDITQTTTEEQRKTEWFDTHSLAQFLDPDDSSKTIEGYPAPKRATFIASVS